MLTRQRRTPYLNPCSIDFSIKMKTTINIYVCKPKKEVQNIIPEVINTKNIVVRKCP